MLPVDGYSLRAGQVGDIASIVSLLIEHGASVVDDSAIVDSLRLHASVVAEHEGSLVGFVYCRPATSDVMELAGFMVHGEHRRRKVGTSMLSFLAERISCDYTALMAMVDESKCEQNFPRENALIFFYRNQFKTVAASVGTDILWHGFS